jgi:HD-GYP domain-containing protein (c-di-GMP phosphodiesterase class II)
VEIVEHHHDYYNGAGLHQVKAGEEIPLGARILTIADSFDAMTSDRPYRPAMPAKAARQEIKRCSGSQFDPAIVNAFLKGNTTISTSEKDNALIVNTSIRI